MMYEEITNIPLLIRTPGCEAGEVTESLASHVDLLPTMMDLAGIPRPESLQGVSLCPALSNPNERPREYAMLGFSRFAINHDDWGEFYPIRCMTDGRYKLCINLHDSDEFYDLLEDPYEMKNLIHEEATSGHRDRLHDALLEELDRIRDPFRSYMWGDRPWRSVRSQFYYGGERRNPPIGFPFQPVGIEADGTMNRRPFGLDV